MIKRTIGALAALTLAACGLAVAAVTMPAAATGGEHGCPPVTHRDLRDVTLVGGGTAELDRAGGLIGKTPAVASEVKWNVTFPSAVKMADVKGMSYETVKLDGTGGIPAGNDAALPAYRVALDADGDGDRDATLVYEPYYQMAGNPVRGFRYELDVKAGKFWSSTTIPGLVGEGGGSYAGNRSWGQILSANPHATVLGFGWSLGDYNAGTVARVNRVRFDGPGKCCEHFWQKPAGGHHPPTHSPTASPTTSPTVRPTATATSTASPSPSTSASPSPTGVPTVTDSPVPPAPGGGGNSPSMPVTGSPVMKLAAGGATLLGVGAVALLGLWLYRRRSQVRVEA